MSPLLVVWSPRALCWHWVNLPGQGAERAPLQAADKSESGTLEGEEFVLFYKALTEREEVLSLFQAFSEDGKKLTLLELVDFLRQEQLEDEGTEELAMELIDKYEPSETGESPELHPALGKGRTETPPAPPAVGGCRQRAHCLPPVIWVQFPLFGSTLPSGGAWPAVGCKVRLWGPLPASPRLLPRAPPSLLVPQPAAGCRGPPAAPLAPTLFPWVSNLLFSHLPAARARHALSADGFLMYLCSPEGSIFNPRHQVLWQDMTQPLCHYFISSSHNTYLIEDQIRGQSSIEGYIR